jgi:hypothetical protein
MNRESTVCYDDLMEGTRSMELRPGVTGFGTVLSLVHQASKVLQLSEP